MSVVQVIFIFLLLGGSSLLGARLTKRVQVQLAASA